MVASSRSMYVLRVSQMCLSNLSGDVIPACPQRKCDHLLVTPLFCLDLLGDTSPVRAAGAEETPLLGWQRLGMQRGRVVAWKALAPMLCL